MVEEVSGRSGLAWSAKLVTGHNPPRPAFVMPGAGPRGLRLVSIMGDYATQRGMDWPTTWHYNEDGTPSGNAAPEWRLREAA